MGLLEDQFPGDPSYMAWADNFEWWCETFAEIFRLLVLVIVTVAALAMC